MNVKINYYQLYIGPPTVIKAQYYDSQEVIAMEMLVANQCVIFPF